MIVYHGSDVVVKKPDVNKSLRHLDFGDGFYVTTVKEQAERWAKRKAILNANKCGIINVYDFTEHTKLNVKNFGEELDDWIDFVCDCRNGSEKHKQYDIIIGKVADDKVFKVVDMYKRGIWDKERALKEIRVYDAYDQIAFISQEAIDKYLLFKESYEVEL